mgnify:CR=1 FL=1
MCGQAGPWDIHLCVCLWDRCRGVGALSPPVNSTPCKDYGPPKPMYFFDVLASIAECQRKLASRMAGLKARQRLEREKLQEEWAKEEEGVSRVSVRLSSQWWHHVV